MFKFLKEKLKSAISKISEGVQKEGKVEERIIEKTEEEQTKKIEKEEKGFFAKLKEKFAGKSEEKEIVEEKKIEVKAEVEEKDLNPKIEIEKEEKQKLEHKKIELSKKEEIKYQTAKPEEKIKPKHEVKEHIKQEKKAEIKEPTKQPIEETPKKFEETQLKKGFFETIKEKIITTKINNEQFEKLFWELELALMENNVAVEVVDKIKKDLKNELVEKPIRRTKVEETIQDTLKNSIGDLFEASDLDLIKEIKNKKGKPYIIAFFGINGSGKTTSIAKLANMLKEKKGFFQRITQTITTKRISAEKFDEMFWDLELALLENNVAVEVIEKIKVDLKSQLVDKPIPRGKVEEAIASSLHTSIEDFSTKAFLTKKTFQLNADGLVLWNGSPHDRRIAKYYDTESAFLFCTLSAQWC